MNWDPFEDFEGMQREMNQIFSRYRTKMPLEWTQPAVDFIDKKDHYIILVNLPGIRKENIHISCTEDYLEISAKSSEKKEEKKENYYFAERAQTAYSRHLSFPEKVIPEKTDGTFKNGVLELTIYKQKNAIKAKKVHSITLK
jgi:HSP20 family protein